MKQNFFKNNDEYFMFLQISQLLIVLFFVTSCTYHLGFRKRNLPGGYTQVTVPMFKNHTSEVGIETYFTEEMIRQFAKGGVAEIVDSNNASVVIEGSIDQLNLERSTKATQQEITLLPSGTVLTNEYRIHILSRVILRRKSDNKVLWENVVKYERSYTAPQLGSAGLNSSNVLYNQSAKRQNIAKMAQDMMTEAHDRMTENF